MNVSSLLPVAEVELDNLLDRLLSSPVMSPFAPELQAFVTALSAALLSSPAARLHPELVALGYWFRPSQLKQMQQDFMRQTSHACARARGLVFHITPANVDTIFVYSWLLSCLAGNCNILRLSSTERPAMRCLLDEVRRVMQNPEFSWMENTIAIVRYGHDDAISAAISARCDMRVIWGGDATVNHIRSLALPPRATELTFADRVSFTVLRASAILDSDMAALARRFVSDMTTFEQMACSSPRAVFWLGEATVTDAAREAFWRDVEAQTVVLDSPLHEPAACQLRLAKAMEYAMSHTVNPVPVQDLMRLPARLYLQHWSASTLHEHEGQGLVLEGRIASLDDLNAIVDRRVQTVSTHGFDEETLQAWVMQLPTGAVDRVVALGSALNFSAIWDGFDLLQHFTRLTTLPRARS